MKSKEVMKLLNVTRQTLYNYVKNGNIKYTKINDKHYIYDDNSVYKLIGIKKEKKNKINISYARVSSNDRKSQLKEQSNRIYNWCILNNIHLDSQLEDIKSGMNFERNGFNNLIQETIKGNVELIIIENKDRLVRFGFELLESIFKYFGTKILVINDTIQNKTYEQELTEDLISIIDCFSDKMYSHRRTLNKLKKEISNDNSKI